jgi:hypothetical protein
MNALLLAVVAGALAGAPLRVGGPVVHALAVLPLDGGPAIVAIAGDTLVALRPGGAAVAGFPIALPAGDPAAGPPAAGDLDGDGRPEIAVATASGRLLVFARGGPAAGFPAKLGAPARAGPSFADVDGDGRPEVVVGDEAGRLHALRRGGAPAPGWPIALGAAVTSSASSARSFAGGPTLAVGCADGLVHAVALPTRKERKGFPLATGYEVTGAPAFADLDEDGALDLVVASQDFSVYAVDGQGRPLAGWPAAAGYRIYGGPALADLDGDGHLDVGYASADGALHAVSAAARPLAGFPVKAAGSFLAAPVAGDLDRDGRADLVALATDGTIVAHGGAGAAVAGFPFAAGGEDARAALALVEAGDGLAVVAGLPGGGLQLARASAPGRAAPARAPWPMAGHDAARAGRSTASPPRWLDLAVEPEAPRAGDALRARWRLVWADLEPGAAEPAPPLEWLRDGVVVPALRGKAQVPAGTTRKGERWSVGLAGAPAAAAAAADVRIGNSRPGAPRVALEPARPARGAPVRVRIVEPARDPDGDALEYDFEWLLDGVPVAGARGEELAGEKLRKDAVLAARVTARDADGAGEPAVAEARVGDSAPGPVRVRLEPQVPRRGQPIVAEAPPPGADADGDPLTLRFRWRVGGEPVNVPLSAGALDPRAARKHQRVAVEVRAFDGKAEGPPASAEVLVANSPPSAPVVEIQPKAPRRGDALRAIVVAPALDADGDPVTYRYEWRRNGEPLRATADGRELPAGAARKGDLVELLVTARDGEEDGAAGRAEARIGNTPPGAARVAIEPAEPRNNEPVRVVFGQRAVDPDGDPLGYAVTWSRDGKPLPAEGEVLDGGYVKKRSRLQVTVVARDGEHEGPPASAEAVVASSPPGAAQVALEPAVPEVGAPLRARLARPASDRDGDPPSYRYRWLRDGVAVSVPDGGTQSRREPFWTGATELPGWQVQRGQRWTVEVQAFDGDGQGPVARAEARVPDPQPAAAGPRAGGGNAPPGPLALALCDGPVATDATLEATLRAPPVDPDGDAVVVRYAWFVNARLLPGKTGPRLAGHKLARHDVVRVVAYAFDGTAMGPEASAECHVANSPPGAPQVLLEPAAPTHASGLRAVIRTPAPDLDGDRIGYRFTWLRDGAPVGTTSAQVAPRTPRPGEIWTVRVRAFDGEAEGPQVVVSARIANQRPPKPVVGVTPITAGAGQPLVCTARAVERDADGDRVEVRARWLKDGEPSAIAEGRLELPAGVVRRGERWICEAWSTDGALESDRVQAYALVKNTPPTEPKLAIEPEKPKRGEPLHCRLAVVPDDADGDRLRLEYAWWKDNQAVQVPAPGWQVPGELVRKGDRWRCGVAAHDGERTGPMGETDVKVVNTPPSAPAVAIAPAAPTTAEPLRCQVTAPSRDPDGDPLRYAYAWFKNGEEQPFGPATAEVPPRLLAEGDRWRCTATPGDGEGSGPAGASLEVRVGGAAVSRGRP